MTMLGVQLFLLLLAAFFAGAMIACFIRRIFFARDNESPAPKGGRGSQEVKQDITEITKTETTTVQTTTTSTVESLRFGRALAGADVTAVPSGTEGEDLSSPAIEAEDPSESGLQAAQATTVVIAAAAVSQQLNRAAANDDDQNVVSAPVEAPVVEASEAEPSETKASVTEPVAEIEMQVVETQAIAAAGGLATASADVVSQTVKAVASSNLSLLRSVRSEALVGSAAASASDGIFAAQNREPDDLKRIRGIGVLIEKKLNSMGILSYAHVANWTASDIARISDLLDFKGRIERESWIEQARILDSGGHTDFSRRH